MRPPNVLFQDKGLLLREVGSAWLTLHVSVVVFTAVALLASQRLQDQNVIILAAFMCAAPVLLASEWYVAGRRSVRSGGVPAVVPPEQRREVLLKIRDKANSYHHDFAGTKRECVQLQTKYIRIRQQARVEGRHDIADKASSGLEEIADIVKDIDRYAADLVEIKTTAAEYLAQLDSPTLDAAALQGWIQTQQVRLDVAAIPKRKVQRLKRMERRLQHQLA